jgi:hypothetical protein
MCLMSEVRIGLRERLKKYNVVPYTECIIVLHRSDETQNFSTNS